MHLDFAKLKDNEQPLMDAYVTFNNKLETTVGFTKLPFSRHSKTAIIYQPWLKRAQIIDEGQHRRDIGLHLSYGILNDKITYESQVRLTKDDGLYQSIILSSGILNDKIEEESLIRKFNDEEINTKIDTLNQNIDNKINLASGDLRNSISEINGQLEIETNSRATVDSNLNLKIDEISGRLNSESQSREYSINSLDLKVDNFSGEVDSKIEDLEQNALGISYSEAADLAKKWAIILG